MAPPVVRAERGAAVARIAVRLRDDAGAPVPDARVRAEPRGAVDAVFATTDAAGFASIDVSVVGWWAVSIDTVPADWLPMAGTRADVPLNVTLTLDAAEPALVVDWIVARTCQVDLSPTVPLADGQIVEGTIYRRTSEGGLQHLRGFRSSARGGVLRIDALPPGDLEMRSNVPGVGAANARFTTEPGRTVSAPLAIRSDGTTLTVEAPTGSRLPAGSYSLGELSQGGEPAVRRDQWVGPADAMRTTLRFEGLVAGEYTVGLPSSAAGGARPVASLLLRAGENVLHLATPPRFRAARKALLVPGVASTIDGVTVIDTSTRDENGVAWGVSLATDGVAREVPTGTVRWIVSDARRPGPDGAVRREFDVQIPDGDGTVTLDVGGAVVESTEGR